STVAFWLLDVSMLFWGINLLTLILSGAIFPLDIFGETISTVLSYFPFSYTVYFPINILTGKLEPSFVITGCLIQIAWIVILFILLKILWKTGLKKYVAVGG